MIEIANLNKSFGSLKVLENFNLSVSSGEIVAIVGPSGCGKSTLLNCITGLDINYKGSIKLNGISSKQYLHNKRISVVLQKYSNFEWQTVTENIYTAFLNRKLNQKDQQERVADLIEKTGLKGFEDSYINELSGGMRQRVAVARALAQNTEIMAFDEPFGSLDIENRISLQRLFSSQIKENKLTALIITHDIDEAIVVSDKLIILKAIPSSVIEEINTKNIIDKYSLEFTKIQEKIEMNLKQAI